MNSVEITQKAFESSVELTRAINDLAEEREELTRTIHIVDVADVRPAIIRLAEIDAQLEAAKQLQRILKQVRREQLKGVH